MTLLIHFYTSEALDIIIEAEGLEAANRLVAAAGGLGVWIPENPSPNHRLTRLVGLDLAKRLSKCLGKGILEVPMLKARVRAARNAEILRLRNQGVPARDIALAVGVHTRCVQRVCTASRGRPPRGKHRG